MSDHVTIGAAAALFGLTPATLRWWERQGLLPVADRVGGRRVYDGTALRRIGLACLCTVVGDMPLHRAALVSNGSSTNTRWRRAVVTEIERLDRDLARLARADRYLRHLVQCVDDDPVADCAYLDAELVDCTPRGRCTESDLVAAARAAPRPGPAADGHEKRSRRDGIRSADGARCPACDGSFTPLRRGRPRTYCSARCRQRAHRTRGRISAG
ncbi:MerR family DNA-binding transcriptional regulator [Pseudonocardia sp. HH130630-07]|uniref:MerR family DNA-binding transcriptional regulator n=1 Tax=Pseudonocardia sp. HH130630-07 TaxID=1690815 RepID=UPI000814D5F2|nr:MerR family DNA-binding transcriptional regulator [Pseudonocardia sp. HH130630-07]ANY09592.1 hypothetical protein AFB00_28905 [Pseudonocardia sp. HH130630-07]